MTETVTLPTWVFVLLLAFALWAAVDRLLVPGVRWVFRRKVNRVIHEINTRLNIELPQFKLTRRQVLVDRLFHDLRVLEDRTLIRKLEPDAPRRGFLYAAARTAAFAASNLWLAATGRWYRFGYACVNFGRPVSMREYGKRTGVDFRQLDDPARHREVERVAAQLMEAIMRIVPVLPVSLVATAFLRNRDAGLSELELKSSVYDLIMQLESAGAHIYVPRADLDYAIGVGLRMLLLRRMVEERDGVFRANPAETALLAYYANAIEPLVRP